MTFRSNLDDVVRARREKDAALDAYRAAVVDAYASGHSAYAIAKATGVGIRSILDLLRRAGTKIR